VFIYNTETNISHCLRENAAEDERCLAMAEDVIVKSRSEGPVITG